MTNGLVGRKLGMTQIYDDAGRLTPVTVVEAGPCRVVQVRGQDRHGYDAVQLAFEDVPDRKLTKAELGHLKATKSPAYGVLREFKLFGESQIGQMLRADVFAKLPWQMGNERVTVHRLKVVEVRPDENLLFVSGAVPGATGGLVIVRKSKKG